MVTLQTKSFSYKTSKVTKRPKKSQKIYEHITNQTQSYSDSRTPPTHGLVGRLAQPNLTLDVVSRTQQNFTDPWIGWAFVLPNPGCGQSDTAGFPNPWVG
jgi:hypothetical protein